MKSEFVHNGHTLRIDIATGHAGVGTVWEGTIYPAFWVSTPDGKRRLLTARGTAAAEKIQLDFGDGAHGSVTIRPTQAGIELVDLAVDLGDLRIIDMFFGVRPLTDAESVSAPDESVPFWPDWRADGFCLPSGRPAPAGSFFRRWDLGHASIALGSFGPAMGTPYAAAFPRPLYAAGLGGDSGWLVAGPGEVPDGALSFEIRSTSGALRWRMREDLWGVGNRSWSAPLRLSWQDTAWDAYAAHFATFPPAREAVRSASCWNTWGDWRSGEKSTVDIARRARELGCEVFAFDDGWETLISNGVPKAGIESDVDSVRQLGLELGFWQSVGWIDDPAAVGLSDADLLRGADGRPRRANWAMDPRDTSGRYCLDPSSERTREFLIERTTRLIETFDPVLLKLDFGYGLPGPDVTAPVDPRYRGERLAHELYGIIAEAARAAKPGVAIQLYGIHPLHANLFDVLALDDMGDHGADEAGGHRHWSVWAALASVTGRAITGSSGYDWAQDAEILLDTAVLGSPSAVLPLLSGAPTVPQLAHRRALHRWYRRSTQWRPLWLDSELGSLSRQPEVRSWGRLEDHALTALCLRDGLASFDGIEFTGDWALISQDDSDVREPGVLAVIPFTAGQLALRCRTEPSVEAFGAGGIWTWHDGVLRLTVSIEDVELGLEGWIVDRDR